MSRALAFMRSLRADDRGATIVEFAMVALPLSILIMGGIDLGHQTYIRSTMQGALNDAARRAAVQDPQFAASGATTEEQVTNTILRQLEPIAPNAEIVVTQANFYDFSGIGNPEKLMTDVNGDGTYDEGDGD